LGRTVGYIITRTNQRHDFNNIAFLGNQSIFKPTVRIYTAKVEFYPRGDQMNQLVVKIKTGLDNGHVPTGNRPANIHNITLLQNHVNQQIPIPQ
jgi:hypothetical protein